MTDQRLFSYTEPAVIAAAEQTAARTIDRGASLYERARHLHRLVRMPRAAIDEAEPRRTRVILRALARALRAERKLGRSGHWSYDMNRHIALMQAFAAEAASLRRRRVS